MAVPGKIYANINRIESTGLQASALSSTGISSGEEIITVAEAQAATEAEDADGFLNNVSQTDTSTDDGVATVSGRQPAVTLDVDIASITPPIDDLINNLPPPVKVDFPTITGPGTSTATSTSPPPPTRAVMNIYGDMARSAGGTPNPPPPSNESGTP